MQKLSLSLHLEQKITEVSLKVPDNIQLKSVLGISISFCVQFLKIFVLGRLLSLYQWVMLLVLFRLTVLFPIQLGM